jgi:pyridoxamine 5'-phosphate oxidase
MNQEQILQFLNANPICHLATMEDGQPRVRGMMMYRADPAGILFHTGAFKSLYEQITRNPRVEICFNSPSLQIRVAGIAKILDDLNLKKEIVEARPFMSPLIEQRGYGVLVVFRVVDCRFTLWTMETNLSPTEYAQL